MERMVLLEFTPARRNGVAAEQLTAMAAEMTGRDETLQKLVRFFILGGYTAAAPPRPSSMTA